MATFGFSVGDFVALGVLIHSVAKSLSESRGSADQIRSVLALLSSVSSAADEARRICVMVDGSALRSQPSSISNAISQEVLLLHRIIEDFTAKSKSYTESLICLRGPRAKREWKKVTWRMFHENDIRELESTLQCHLTALNMYIVAHLRLISYPTSHGIPLIRSVRPLTRHGVFWLTSKKRGSRPCRRCHLIFR